MEETKDEVVKDEKLDKKVEAFITSKLADTRVLRNHPINIAGKAKTFHIATNSVLYDVDIAQSEFEAKCEFLHSGTEGITLQYRVVKEVKGKYIVVFKSDSYVSNGKVRRNNIKVEV